MPKKDAYLIDFTEYKIFVERLNTLRGGRSKAAFARECGLSQTTMLGYLNGESQPNIENLIKIAKSQHVSVAWLVGETEDPGGGGADRNVVTGEPLSDEYALIPLYDVRAAAGYGAIVEDEHIINWLAFRKEWLWRELRANISDLYLIEVDGESMEPTLRPGDVILVDRRDAQNVPRDGIYVLRMDGSLLVKRLQRLPGRKINVTSDNEAYKPFEIDLDRATDDIAIIGRVVWAGRRM